MSFLNLMRNKLKPKEVNEALENMTMPPAEDVTYDNTESDLDATNVQSAVDEVYETLLSNLSLTNVVRFSVNLTASNLILVAMTNTENQDGIHIYFSTTSTKKITVYKRENGTSTELYSFT